MPLPRHVRHANSTMQSNPAGGTCRVHAASQHIHNGCSSGVAELGLAIGLAITRCGAATPSQPFLRASPSQRMSKCLLSPLLCAHICEVPGLRPLLNSHFVGLGTLEGRNHKTCSLFIFIDLWRPCPRGAWPCSGRCHCLVISLIKQLVRLNSDTLSLHRTLRQ